MNNPYPPDPNRPQDRPAPSFPTYARPQDQQGPQHQQQHQQGPYQAPPNPPYLPAYPPQYPAPYQQPYQAYPPAYGYGYPGGFQKTNSLAIAALVTGLGGLVLPFTAPVAVGLGIAALVQIKRRSESGTAQAVVGLVAGSVISLFWAFILAIGVMSGISGGEEYDSAPGPGTGSAGPGTYIVALVVGECFDETGGEDEDEVERQACNAPHDGEVYGVVTLPGQTWPGDRQLGEQAERTCAEEFRPYVGIDADDSELELVSWYPDRDAWREGDRTATCTAYGPDGDRLDKTVKNSKR